MERFAIHSQPKCPNLLLRSRTLRVSLITPALLRIEKAPFTDLATQTVWNRDLGKAEARISRDGDVFAIRTDRALFTVDVRLGKVLSVTPKGGWTVTDLFRDNLMGTARTLDAVNGSIPLQPGILSRSGVSVMDDSKSLLLTPEGRILPRQPCSDLYVFAYGHRYLDQLRDFFRITGPVPLIPKYALGNWWSRYRAYTQTEYLDLMEQFRRRDIPLTVATIDMDWHWTDVLSRFGPDAAPPRARTKEELFYNLRLPGWTGYSWNRELFPDHRAMLRKLHDWGLHVTLNVHPSQGIRYFEDCYVPLCKAFDRDPEKREPVEFDIADPRFVRAYFDWVHHPLEAEGVDFWWLDWQQGKTSRIPGLDPLWALNHYHTLDADRQDKRPLILSRYAGLGSHRYPLGFSGDTVVTWQSLQFAPYFTGNAANAGYTWWSHDIGGHMHGVQDDELYLRWLQFGVFSPINRLHSTNSEFMGKEPWKRSWAVCKASEEFLRLRHRLIPFLYTANDLTHTRGIPICMPMYYRYDCEEAYQAKNQYLFGDQLLVCPITEPGDKRLNLASARVWLPEGRWTDLFTGHAYRGGGWVTMYRDLDSIPVLVPEGGIVPMYHNGDTNDLSLAQPLDIHLWYGNGQYSLYEDDGETNAFRRGIFAVTEFTLRVQGDVLTLTVRPPEDSHGLLPEQRTMYLRFQDVEECECTVNGSPVPFCPAIPVSVGDQPVEVMLTGVRRRRNPDPAQLRSNLLTRVQGSNLWKARCFGNDASLPGFVKAALEELEALCP